MTASPGKKKLKDLEKYAVESGATRARVFSARLVAMDERVRMKCQIPLCPHFGRTLTCPPNIPGFQEFERVVGLYDRAILVQMTSPISGDIDDYDRDEVLKYIAAPGKQTKKGGGGKTAQELNSMKVAAVRLHKLINEVEGKAMSMGFHFALGLIGGECMLCSECVGVGSAEGCRRPYQARPSLEGVGIDVYRTCIDAGMPFEMPPKKEVVWSGLVLVD